jgi:5-enolpyruvylshikimate-3-phosphate synthase
VAVAASPPPSGVTVNLAAAGSVTVRHAVEMLRARLASRSPIVVEPSASSLHGALVRTYGDHRMAMAFALIGLRVEGIEIDDPSCVAKTFPRFWETLEGLRLPPAPDGSG